MEGGELRGEGLNEVPGGVGEPMRETLLKTWMRRSALGAMALRYSG